MNNFTEMVQKYFGSTGEKLQQMSDYAENHAKIEAKDSLHRILDTDEEFNTTLPLSLWILNGLGLSDRSFLVLDDPSNLPTREFRIKVDSGILDLPPNIDVVSILESTIKDFMINTIMGEIQSGSGIEFGTLVSRYQIDRSSQSLVIQSRFKIIN